jgi:hypothetical protein
MKVSANLDQAIEKALQGVELDEFIGGPSGALAILYAFSIVVRYLPETWHSIEHGSLDNVRALLEHYLVIVDNVLPHLAVERLTQKRLLVVHPGSMNAPV